MRFALNFLGAVLVSMLLVFQSQAQEYGHTDFQASGDADAHKAFVQGLLKLHNFEYPDARESFQEAIAIDPDFTMAYWGLALSYEQSFWRRYQTDQSREALAKLGATSEERASKAITQREKDYLATTEILFGEGEQREREIAYSQSLQALHEKYPDDLDAAAFYALSILVTTYGGRDYARYMKAGAITEEVLDKNPRHPGALHYNIHSYDDPTHAPLGLRAARVYNEVAPSAIHALHMGSHIYYALGMWELGVERNVRSFEEAVARQDDPDDPYAGQAYHALTWVPYGLQQMDENEKALEYIAKIQAQVHKYGQDAAVHRNHFATTRASFLVDTQDWDHALAMVKVDRADMSTYALVCDLYVEGMVALHNESLKDARAVLAKIEDQIADDGHGAMSGMEGMVMTSGRRSELAPRLLGMALAGQIEMADGNAGKAVELITKAEALEAALPAEYGPAVPVQPMAELLGDVYRELGKEDESKRYYEASLERAVGRIRSVEGLGKLQSK